MSRLIDTDAFKEYMRGACEEVSHMYKDGGKWAKQITEDFCMDIDEQPTIEERKKGKWIEITDHETPIVCKCTECGWLTTHYDSFLFCPNCGAEMERRCQ